MPTSHPPSLLFSNIDSNVTALDLKEQLTQINRYLIAINFVLSEIFINTIKLFDKAAERAAFIQFDNTESARAIYNYFNSPTRTAKNLEGKKIEVQWCADQSISGPNNWVAVVLRNLPPDSHIETLYRNCSKGGEKIKYITKPQCLKG